MTFSLYYLIYVVLVLGTVTERFAEKERSALVVDNTTVR